MKSEIDLNYLGETVSAVLADQEAWIHDHIDRQTELGRRGGIEPAFAVPLIERLARDGRIRPPDSIALRTTPLRDLSQDHIASVTQGLVRTTTVRLPRLKTDASSDLDQLTADYRKLTKLRRRGILLVFLHGPLVEDAKSAKALWRTFHNQAFLEVQIAKAEGRLSARPDILEAAKGLGWLSVRAHATVPDYGRAALAGRIGAVMMDCGK